jgi:hypothetical protein
MGPRDVGEIMQRGGTILGSARSAEFREEPGRRQALDHLRARGIQALIVIGGNGSQTGAHALSQMGFPIVGVASTIDNDLYGSDVTIGVDTALNIALENIDRLKVTASSHHRGFLVEAALHPELLRIAQQTTEGGFGAVLYAGVFAGWLIALLSWLLASTQYSGTQVAFVFQLIAAF